MFHPIWVFMRHSSADQWATGLKNMNLNADDSLATSIATNFQDHSSESASTGESHSKDDNGSQKEEFGRRKINNESQDIGVKHLTTCDDHDDNTVGQLLPAFCR